jgi:uncharacterized protein
LKNYSPIPTIAELALEYGTINKEQFSQIQHIFNNRRKKNEETSFPRIMLNLRMATQYQLSLLELIQEYLIIRAKGEAFGRLAVEKGYATEADIKTALLVQQQEFKRTKLKRLIGDILVESGSITEKQKKQILNEQALLDKYTTEILYPETVPDIDKNNKIESLEKDALSDYEKKFLEIKALDYEFAASVMEKGLASEPEVVSAQRLQEKLFNEKKEISFLGDILVGQNIITREQSDSILAEQNRRRSELSDPVLSVEISENNLEAQVRIHTKHIRPTLDDIKTALSDHSITQGIYSDPVLQCYLDSKKDRFTVARQDFSLELIKRHKTLYFFTVGKVNDQIKKKGEPLAEQTLSDERYLKKDLFDRPIEVPVGTMPLLRCGSGARVSSDRLKIFAGKTGFPSLSIDKKFYVHPIINVLEDADLRYGPLEAFANLNVSGVITGAYPVTAGNLKAVEIRGATIEAIGDVVVEIGITDAVIRAQGSIKARYIHNSTIQAFEDIHVNHEIMDSKIACSGQLKAENCRIFASEIAAKKGIIAGGIGSDKTNPCSIFIGSEHHILNEAEIVENKIRKLRSKVDLLEDKLRKESTKSNNLFQKMVELKIFYDRAKKKKDKIEHEFRLRKDTLPEIKQKNVVRLIQIFDGRMKSAIETLKKLNARKKISDNIIKQIENKIAAMLPAVKEETDQLETDRFLFFEWTRKQINIPEILITGKACQGTFFKGIYASLTLKEDLENIFVSERKKRHQNELSYEIQIKNNN